MDLRTHGYSEYVGHNEGYDQSYAAHRVRVGVDMPIDARMVDRNPFGPLRDISFHAFVKDGWSPSVFDVAQILLPGS
jgi:hypothetical protein